MMPVHQVYMFLVHHKIIVEYDARTPKLFNEKYLA